MTMVGFIAAASVITAPACIHKAMIAPAVAIAPAGPGTYAKEDPVVEEPRPVKAYGCAGVGRSFVVAVGANRRNADFHCDLCFRSWRQEQACE
jgi:acetaldehyde dehydrogenase (acetylating)